MESCVGVLLSFSGDDPESILATYERMRSFLPRERCRSPTMVEGTSSALDYSGGTPPSIGYWHHGADSLIRLAPSFTAFLGMLYDESPESQSQ